MWVGAVGVRHAAADILGASVSAIPTHCPNPATLPSRPVTAAKCWLRSVYLGDNAPSVNWLMTTNSCIDGIGAHCNSCVVVGTAVQPPDRPNDPATNPHQPKPNHRKSVEQHPIWICCPSTDDLPNWLWYGLSTHHSAQVLT